MKRYFITVILTAMFCGNILSQNQVTFPHVIIDGIVNSTNIINDDCNGGNYVIRMQLYPSSYYVSGIELYDLFYLSLTSAGYYPRLMITNVEINPANNQVFATLYISKNTTSDINLIINGANGGYIIIHQLTCPPPDPITGDANNGNWIIKTTYTAPNAASYYRDITYYNGLGYPEQVIQIKGSPNMKNIVKPVYYDNMRRDNAKVYLPYISANNTAARESSPFTVQTAFYQNKFGADDGQYAYVENVFEASPLNKILQTYNVGKVYRTNDKKTVNNYGANSANEVLLMNVNQANGYVTITGRYAANTLYRNSTVNEDGATVYTYTDKLGQTILTRTKGDNNQNFDTYYVYDNFGRLVMVVPPEYSSNLGTNTTLIPGSTMVAHYCYTYKYDGRGNIIERQIPGKATEYIIYDKDDRPVLYQDGNMRENNQWIYSVYDNVGNLIDKTLVKTTLTRQQIQTKYFASNFHNDYVSLGQSSSIYAPFGGENFEEEYLIHSVRYYGKEYYLRNNLAAGIYLKVNTSVISSADNRFVVSTFSETQDETISSIDINGNVIEKAVPREVLINDGGSGGGSGGGGSGGGSGGGNGYLPVEPLPPDPVLKPDSVCDPTHLYINSTFHVKSEHLYYTDPLFSNIKYYHIPSEYMSIAECLAANFHAYNIFEGVPGGTTAVWKNPSSLAFEPVAGVCGYSELDTVKVRHLKAYEKIKILADGGDFVERVFYYDSKGRVIQTVEKNHLGYISRYSIKYDFVGTILAQHENHKTSNTATDTKLTTFTYDQRGRLLTETTTVNGGNTAKVEYKYDDLGQQIAKVYDNNLVVDSTKYNIQGWITEKNAKKGTDNLFNMKLAYYSPAQPNTMPSYTGNITEWTWRHENSDARTYAFEYDKLSRLTGSLLYMNNTLSNAFTEQGLTYSKNGNILTLKRYGETALINDIVCGYSGNRLWTVNNTPAYNYDANGNMNKDYRKNLDFEYNLLNLPYKVITNDTLKATYKYLADGTKLSAMADSSLAGSSNSNAFKNGIIRNGFDYLGSMVYAVNNNVRTLESTNFGGGRINKTDNNMYDINYFITDHLGSTRVIVGSNGEIKEQKDYYPFGKEHENPNLITSTNRWGFSGKEKQTIKDLGFLDFGARMLETEIGRWFVIDPLAEKYYSVSPYVYCMNNPLKYVDPTGKNPEHPDEEEERRRKQEEEQRRKIAEQNGEFTLSFGENLRQALEIKIDLSTEEEREKASENQKQKEEQEQENSDNSDVAGEYLVKGMTIAAVASQMDSPLPGPGDVAGIGIAVGVTVTAGVIWLGEKIFDSFKDHRKGKDWQTHSKPRPGGDPANGRYGRGKNDNRGNKNRKYIPPPNPNKRP